MPTNLQNFTHKDLTEVKIFLNVLRGPTFLKHPVYIAPFHKNNYNKTLINNITFSSEPD